MVDARQGSGGFSIGTGGSTCFWAAGLSYLQGTASTTESQQQVTYRTPGVMSNGFASVGSFTSSGSVSLRKNGVTQSLSVAISATGVFEDTTHTFTISAADKINYITSGNYSIVLLANTFAATTNTAIRCLSCNNGSNVSFSSTGPYTPIGGSYLGFGGSDSSVQTTVRATGTLANGIVNVTSNGSSTSGTVTSRVNAAAGNISAAISSTGIFEDTTHTDSVSSSDLVNLLVGGGTLNCTASYAGCDFVTSAGKVPQIHYDENTGDQTVASGTTIYFQMGAGDMSSETGGGGGQISTRDTFTYSGMESNILANSTTAATTVMFRANASNTSLTFTISSGGTGFFQDTTHTYVAASTDLVVIACTAGTGGTLSPASFNVWEFLSSSILNTIGINEYPMMKATVLQ